MENNIGEMTDTEFLEFMVDQLISLEGVSSLENPNGINTLPMQHRILDIADRIEKTQAYLERCSNPTNEEALVELLWAKNSA